MKMVCSQPLGAVIGSQGPRLGAIAAGRADITVLEALLGRRSVSPRRLLPPGPDAAEIRTIVSVATAAPDHGLLRPARFIHISDPKRAALSDVFEAALLERDPEACPEARAHARSKARNGAVLVALVARITWDHPVVPASEQWVSVGAGLQNVLLAAEALGYRAMIVSGPVTRSRALAGAFDLGADESMVGFIAIGTPSKMPSRRRSTGYNQDILTTW